MSHSGFITASCQEPLSGQSTEKSSKLSLNQLENLKEFQKALPGMIKEQEKQEALEKKRAELRRVTNRNRELIAAIKSKVEGCLSGPVPTVIPSQEIAIDREYILERIQALAKALNPKAEIEEAKLYHSIE